jgi:hypothetical protein
VRYTNGTMPGSYGFTGQRADATTGLDYYGARYHENVPAGVARRDGVVHNGGAGTNT